MPHKDIYYRSAKAYDQAQLFFGLLGGMVDLKDFFLQRRFLNYIASMGRKNVVTGIP